MTIFSALLALTLLSWAGMLWTFTQPPSGHDIGLGLLGGLLAIVAWVLLAALLLMGGRNGEMPRWAVWLAWILHPATFAAVIAVIDKSGRSAEWGYLPMAVPILAPPLMAAYASLAYFPAVRSAVPASAGAIVWSLLFLLAILPWIEMVQHDAAYEEGQAIAAKESVAYQGAQERPENLKKLAALPQDSPLWAWVEYMRPERGVRDEALEGIRNLKRRQADAENMVSQGVVEFLVDLPDLNLELTPPIVEAHKKYVVGLAQETERPDAGSVAYSWVANRVDAYLRTIQWMAQQHCGCSSEVARLERSIRRYKNSRGRRECLAALEKAIADDKDGTP